MLIKKQMTSNYEKINYPWALSLDKLNAAYDALIASDVVINEESVKAKYIELKGRVEASEADTTAAAPA